LTKLGQMDSKIPEKLGLSGTQFMLHHD
jgi:hypothetical protein